MLSSSGSGAGTRMWLIWRGRATGDYWALPPRGHPRMHQLITASDIGKLAQRLSQAEEQYDV